MDLERWFLEKLGSDVPGKRGNNNTIYKIPDKLKEEKSDAYTPRFFSIGPLTRSNEKLYSGEEIKLHYMFYLLHLTDDPVECLRSCQSKINENCSCSVYPCNQTGLPFPSNVSDLTPIMVLDGCFLLELFRRSFDDYLVDTANLLLWDVSWMVEALYHDLLLLENQIPFFILEILWDEIKSHSSLERNSPTLSHMALHFFQPILSFRTDFSMPDKKCKHLLHLIYCSLLGYVEDTPTMSDSTLKHLRKWKFSLRRRDEQLPARRSLIRGGNKKSPGFFCRAAELTLAGIKFQGVEDNLLAGIEFDPTEKKLKLPSLYINDYTESLFRNLIAMELLTPSGGNHFTSYIILMKSLIVSPLDVTFLQKQGIIKRCQLNSEALEILFRSISDIDLTDHFFYSDVCSIVKEHAEATSVPGQILLSCREFGANYRREILYMMRTYFKDPLTFLNITNAIFVVTLLTILQTCFAMLDYYYK